MGRPSDPISIAEAKGSTKKNPKRYKARQNGPATSGEIGDPPAHFYEPSSYGVEKRVKVWFELIAECPAGVLTSADRQQFAVICDLALESRRIGCKQNVRSAFTKELAKLGMNPVARAAMGTRVEAPKDALDSFVRKKKA